MREKVLTALLLILGILAVGCGAPEPPMACSEGDWQIDKRPRPPRFEYCERFDMVCNEAVTLAEVCPDFLSELIAYAETTILPTLSRYLRFLPWLDPEEMLNWVLNNLEGACGYIDILDRVGTCQPPGELGFPCAEDADCAESILCVEGVCGGTL